MSAIHTVLHREAATWAGQWRRRPKGPAAGWLLIPEPMPGAGPAGVGLSAAARAGPTAEPKAKSHLHFPFPAHRAQFRDHPRTPRHKERFCSIWVCSKFIGLSQLPGPPGFVVHPSRPPRQGRDPEESPNYNPHSAPRASPIPAARPLPVRQPAPEDLQRETGCSCQPGHPTGCSPARAGLSRTHYQGAAGRPTVGDEIKVGLGWGPGHPHRAVSVSSRRACRGGGVAYGCHGSASRAVGAVRGLGVSSGEEPENISRVRGEGGASASLERGRW